MGTTHRFQGRPCEGESSLLGGRGSLRDALRDRDLAARLTERGLTVDPTTRDRWGQDQAPELEKRPQPPLKAPPDSGRVAERDSKVQGEGVYGDRAVESQGNRREFRLSAPRAAAAAYAFFEKVLRAPHTVDPRGSQVANNAAYPKPVEDLKAAPCRSRACELRQVRYRNPLIEPDPRFLKGRPRPGLGFFALGTAQRTFSGYATMHRLRTGLVNGVDQGPLLAPVRFVTHLFGVAA